MKVTAMLRGARVAQPAPSSLPWLASKMAACTHVTPPDLLRVAVSRIRHTQARELGICPNARLSATLRLFGSASGRVPGADGKPMQQQQTTLLARATLKDVGNHASDMGICPNSQLSAKPLISTVGPTLGPGGKADAVWRRAPALPAQSASRLCRQLARTSSYAEVVALQSLMKENIR